MGASRRPRYRWTRLAALGLCAGIVLNILVAWGVSVVGLPGRVSVNWDTIGPAWPRQPPAGWPESPDRWITGDGFGYTIRGAHQNVAELARTRRNDPTVVACFMTVESYGLPWRSMRTMRLLIQQGRTFLLTENDQSILECGLLVPEWLNRRRVATNRIAFEPIWPGFLLNSVFYGVLTVALILGFVGLRARRRCRCGRCVYCNYNVAGLDLCPECGSRVRRNSP